MPLSSGSRLGAYEIVAPIGAGGMGEVYRARDTRLKREVAIKVLPADVAGDPDRLARFKREAELLASLHHPNIAVVYGFEESESVVAIAMELIEGGTLEQKLEGMRDSGLGMSESIRIARQIIDALEAAHDKGIVHRDLKPGNIMLTTDSQVKVLDFGLARIEERSGGSGGSGGPSGATHSPTLTFAGTQAGLILGTASYMSPEQAKGRIADKRSDVWAFGCVLYEMLTGRRAFDGEDVTEIIASVVKTDPDWRAFPREVPLPIQTIVQRCLLKDRKARIPDMAVVRFLFDDAAGVAAVPAPIPSGRSRAAALGWRVAAGLLLLTTIAGFAGWYAARSVVPPVARFFVSPPERGSFVVIAGGTPVVSPHAAISPDGRTLAFGARDAAGKASLWLRPIDSATAQPLAGTEGASYPFWSPDSRFIGYFAGGKLWKIPASGGPSQLICARTGRGATWDRDGVIVFNGGPAPLMRVSSAGGDPVQLTKDAASFPSFLPDGRHVLFFRGQGEVAVASLDDGIAHRLLSAESGAVYARSGHLLFVRQGTLLAQEFDAKTLTLSGEPFSVAERVQAGSPPGFISFSVSDNGVLAFGTSTGGLVGSVQLTWLDRQGRKLGTVGTADDIRGVDLSPDGTRLAAHRHAPGPRGDIWITDLARDATSRFTYDDTQENASPIWSPDGATITFTSRRAGKSGIYVKPADESRREEPLVEQVSEMAPTGWSPDGRSLVYNAISTGGPNLWLLPLTGDRKAVQLLSGRFPERHGQVSRDGRWLAYTSSESGRQEVYIQPFPSGAGKSPISTGGGIAPRWRGDGRELFYLDAQGSRLLAVDISAGGSRLEAGTPRPLFETAIANAGHPGPYHPYAVSADGQRFLIPRQVSTGADDAQSAPVVVVTNWLAAIQK